MKESNNVIGLSLWRDDIDFTYGALRNVQLAMLFFPKWKIRIFIPKSTQNTTNISIPKNVILKMKELGADIGYIDVEKIKIPFNLLSTLLADDYAVHYFIIRAVRNRLNRRDADAVNEWIASKQAVHCIRDIPKHINMIIVPELWGGNTRKLHICLNKKKMKDFIQVKNILK